MRLVTLLMMSVAASTATSVLVSTLIILGERLMQP